MDSNDDEDKALYGADLPHASLNGVNKVTPDETACRRTAKRLAAAMSALSRPEKPPA